MKEPVSRNEVNKEAFGRRLTQAMEERRETTYSMADSVSLTASTISRYANGKMAPKIPTLFQLADHLQVNPLWLMGYDRPREQARSAGGRIPVVQVPGALPEPDAAESVLLLFSDQPLQADFCFCVADDSMSGARILAGDYVFVKRQNDVADGEIAAVDIGGAFSLRRVYKAGGRTIMKTEPVRMETTPDSAPIIGKVVAFQGLAR